MNKRFFYILQCKSLLILSATSLYCFAFQYQSIPPSRQRVPSLFAVSSNESAELRNAKEESFIAKFRNLFPTRELQSITIPAIILAGTLLSPWGLELDRPSLHHRHDAASERSMLVISVQQSNAAWALTESQQLVDEVWKEVTRQFVDRNFAGMGEEGWRQKRLEAIKQVSQYDTPDDAEQVHNVIRSMLENLKDPYTRYLDADQFESLTAYAKGTTTTGVGVQLIVEPKNGDIVVVNTVPDGPAQKTGVLPGDVIVSVNGDDVKGTTAEVAAAKCRGTVGSDVVFELRHEGQTTSSKIVLTRAPIRNNPVQVSTFTAKSGKKVGLLKLTSFSQETVKQVSDALDSKIGKVSELVIDLRGNGGGYMPAGVDLAKLFLPPQARIVSELDKNGRATVFINDGVGSESNLPLYVLVDKRTASASEIFAAAIQDNKRGIIVGSSNTFGKGRIQNVQQLSDEGGIAVTKAKYITPNGRDIHGVGIAPDKEPAYCEESDSASVCLALVL